MAFTGDRRLDDGEIGAVPVPAVRIQFESWRGQENLRRIDIEIIGIAVLKDLNGLRPSFGSVPSGEAVAAAVVRHIR